MADAGSSKTPDYNSSVPHVLGYYDAEAKKCFICDPIADHTRTCPCVATYSYPNRVVHQLERERGILTRGFLQECCAAQERVEKLEHYLA